MVRTLSCLAGILATTVTLGAQDTTGLPRLDPQTRAAVARVVDSARALRLPTAPLEWKISEGALKGIEGARVYAAVERTFSALRTARDALGKASSDGELVAGMDAVLAGVAPDQLARIRTSPESRPVTTRLVVLTDLVSRGVPAASAVNIIVQLSLAGAPDTNFTTLRREVVADVTAGISPGTAVAARARQLSARLPLPAPAHTDRRPLPFDTLW